MERVKSSAMKKQSLPVKKPMLGKNAKAKTKKMPAAKAPPMAVAKAKSMAKPKAKPILEKELEKPESMSVEGKHHDIIQMILDDHKPLKRCIEILKNSELNLRARRAAFNEFAPLLTIHAKAEEAVLYTYEKTEIGMRENAFEGIIEHALAEQMVEEAKQSVDKDIWSANAKVLAELVEHHITEEETEMFPKLKKEANASDLIRLGEEYQAKKNEIKIDVLHPAVQKQLPTLSARH